MNQSFTKQSIVYTYGMFVLHANKNPMFYAGTVEYHNLVLIGLSEMEAEGCLHIEWKEEGQGNPPKELSKSTTSETQNAGLQVILTRGSSLPEHLNIFTDIYNRIPDAEGITIEKLLQDIYLSELNKEETDLQKKLQDGMREYDMIQAIEKKGFLRRRKQTAAIRETLWEEARERLREELDQITQQNKEVHLSLPTFILATLLCQGNLLPDMFGKKEAKHYWQQIMALNDQSPYRESSFSKFLITIREIEPDLFTLVSLKVPAQS